MNLRYFPSFDGLRALAIILVVLSHWPYHTFSLKFGWLGVSIFFVLSGFLITNILVAARTKPLRTYLEHFYKNRALRILPLYYLYLLVISVVLLLIQALTSPAELTRILEYGAIAVKNDLLYLLTYTYNFQDIWHLFDGKDDSNHVVFFSHFWSLAVEEQYYLVFPFLVYFFPFGKLKKALWIMAVLPVFLRLGIGEYFRNSFPDYFMGMVLAKLPFFHLDAFALGGILALSPWEKVKRPQVYLFGFLLFCLVYGVVAVYFLQKDGIDISYKSLGFDHPLYQYGQHSNTIFKYRYAITYTLVNIGSLLLLLTVLHANFMNAILSKSLFRKLGQISYGIYVFHFPLLGLLVNWLKTSGSEDPMNSKTWLEFTIFAGYVLVTVGISWVSFHYFETRFLKLKHKTLSESDLPQTKNV